MKRKMVGLAATLMAILAAGLSSFGQYSGLKEGIKGKLQGGMEERNAALNEAMGEKAAQGGQEARSSNPEIAIKTGWIMRKNIGGRDVRYYFAYPQIPVKGKSAKAMLVLHEWWGLNDETLERARLFATHGYYAVAPDLYHGSVTEDPAVAAKLEKRLLDGDAMASMKMGVDILQQETQNGAVGPTLMGAFGSDLGGRQALLLAVNDPRINVTLVWYGRLITDPVQLGRMHGVFMGYFAGNDPSPSPGDVNAFLNGIQEAKTKHLFRRPFFCGTGSATPSKHGYASKAFSKLGNYNASEASAQWSLLWEFLAQDSLNKYLVP